MILASKSPRRRELLGMLTPNFTVVEAGVNEDASTSASPAGLAGNLARQKALAVFAMHPQSAVIGCDTVVEVKGRALGKPVDAEEAKEMLAALSGRTHQVHTGVCICLPGQQPEFFVETTKVTVASVSAADIDAYTATKEPYDKAGGYAIQGHFARYIPRIEGCYYNVMGLPVAALYQALHRLGLL